MQKLGSVLLASGVLIGAGCLWLLYAGCTPHALIVGAFHYQPNMFSCMLKSCKICNSSTPFSDALQHQADTSRKEEEIF